MGNKLIRIKGACPVMLAFVQRWRFGLHGKAERETLVSDALALLPNTKATAEVEEARSWLAIDWMARDFAPIFLDLHPHLSAHATGLRSLRPIEDVGTAKVGRAHLDAAGGAAWDAAQDAAWSAARDASCVAIRGTTDTAAWEATEAAAEAAAWAAALAAARGVADAAGWGGGKGAAYIAARAAARGAAKAAATEAARVAPYLTACIAAWDASQAAARRVLTPPTQLAQQSAIALLRSMGRLGGGGGGEAVFLDCPSWDGAVSEGAKARFLEVCALEDVLPAAAPRRVAGRL